MLFTPEYTIKMPIPEALLRAVIGIATVLLILAIIDVLILLVSKIIGKITSKTSNDIETVSSSETPKTALPSNDKVDLVNVDEPTAAVLMAIVSDKSGIPLSRLRFKSIKLLEDDKQ